MVVDVLVVVVDVVGAAVVEGVGPIVVVDVLIVVVDVVGAVVVVDVEPIETLILSSTGLLET